MSPIYDSRFSQSKRDDALQLDKQVSEQTVRLEYIKPIVILGLAFPLALVLVFGSIHSGQDISSANVLGAHLFRFGISLFIAMAALLLAAKILVGSFGPVGLAVLRMSSALAVFDVVYLLLGGGFNITVFPGLVAMVILAGMTMWLFDFDLFEGALVAIIICVVKLCIVLGLFYVMW